MGTDCWLCPPLQGRRILKEVLSRYRYIWNATEQVLWPGVQPQMPKAYKGLREWIQAWIRKSLKITEYTEITFGLGNPWAESSWKLGVLPEVITFKQGELEQIAQDHGKKHIFPVRKSKHWHRLLRGCGISCLEIFKSSLDVSLGVLIWVVLLEQGLDQRSNSPFQSQPICDWVILWFCVSMILWNWSALSFCFQTQLMGAELFCHGSKEGVTFSLCLTKYFSTHLTMQINPLKLM